MKSIRKILAIALLIPDILVAILLLISAYAEFIPPSWSAFPALLGLVFPIFAVIHFLFLLAFFFIYPRYSIFPIGVFLLCIPALWKYTPIHFNDYIEDNRPGFTLLSYNVYHFNNADIESNPDVANLDYNRTLQNILNYDADIAMIQESPFPTRIRNWRKINAEQLSQLERQYPYHVIGHNSFVLSKYPIEAVFDTTYTASAFTNISRVDIEGRKITLFNNHLQSIGLDSDDKELYKELMVQPDSIKNKWGNIKQMTRKFLRAFEARNAQVRFIDSVADNTPGNIIMCGDINDTPNSYAYRELKKDRRDAFLDKGCGPGYTYRSNRMWVRIDHVFYEGDFTVRYIEKGNMRSSDHFPLFVRFDWE